MTNTIVHGSLFDGLRARLATYFQEGMHPTILRKLAFVPTCQYCCSHWVGAGVVLAFGGITWESLVAYFPAVWVANHLIVAYGFLSTLQGESRHRSMILQQQLWQASRPPVKRAPGSTDGV